MELVELLKQCSGIEYQDKNTFNRRNSISFFKVGDIKLPTDQDFYIRINHTATAGTIGKLVDLYIDTYENRSDSRVPIYTYQITYIYTADGRKGRGRIKCTYATILNGVHQTNYVRTVNKSEKVEIKNPINKFKQELHEGDWVVGVSGRRIKIGRITRWTNHNVWAVPTMDLSDKSKEFKFDNITETFTMPNDEHVQLLTMAVMKGWNGK